MEKEKYVLNKIWNDLYDLWLPRERKKSNNVSTPYNDGLVDGLHGAMEIVEKYQREIEGENHG